MTDVHHCSGPSVSEMTYTVSSGTLNSTILFQMESWWFFHGREPVPVSDAGIVCGARLVSQTDGDLPRLRWYSLRLQRDGQAELA